jgi:hypothetical protein
MTEAVSSSVTQFFIVVSGCVAKVHQFFYYYLTSLFSHHCTRFTGSSCRTTCFDKTGHHQVSPHKMHLKHCTCVKHMVRDTPNIVISVKIFTLYAKKLFLTYKMFERNYVTSAVEVLILF